MATPLEAALAEIRAKTARIQEIKAELTGLAEEVEALRQAPMSRDDYKTFLPKLVALAGAAVLKETGVSAYIRGSILGEVPAPQKSWRDMEQAGYMPDFMRVLNRAPVFSLLCWFDPIRAEQSLSDLIDSVAPEGWGNNEHPAIAQRVQIIAERQTRIATLNAEKNGLEAEIDVVVKSAGGVVEV